MQDFALPNGTVLRFTSEVAMLLEKYRQATPTSKEAGGMLFARFNPQLITVERATTPSRFDSRSRFAFRPSLAYQRKVILEQFRKGLHFIGEWHTHPQDQPQPSQQDIQTARECLLQSQHELNGMAIVVLGSDGTFATAWVGVISKIDIQRLSLA